MRLLSIVPKIILVLALLVGANATPAPAQVSIGLGVSINIGPPALPVYVQPPCPAPGYIWTPGYWAWGGGGYYWVPGTWVIAPQVGYLWTPGYWGWGGGYYAWHPGYWGPHIGYYGGINYGFGYAGVGYVGGGWYGNQFRYNTAVTNVNTTNVTNVYVDKTVVNNTTINNYNNSTINRVSYNGGPGGVTATPRPDERLALSEEHLPPTSVQMQHQHVASLDRNSLASVNHGMPPNAAVAAPLSKTNRPAGFAPLQAEDRAAAKAHVVTPAAAGGSNAAFSRFNESRNLESTHPATGETVHSASAAYTAPKTYSGSAEHYTAPKTYSGSTEHYTAPKTYSTQHYSAPKSYSAPHYSAPKPQVHTNPAPAPKAPHGKR